MKAQNYTTAGMSYCVDTSIKDWELVINDSLVGLKKVLPQNKYKILMNSQEKWEAYKVADWRLQDEIFDDIIGTMYINIKSAEVAAIVENRARELDYLLEIFNRAEHIPQN